MSTRNHHIDLNDMERIRGAFQSFTVGNVTTGAAGTSASVTIRGTHPNYILDFVLPCGNKGAKGAILLHGRNAHRICEDFCRPARQSNRRVAQLRKETITKQGGKQP